MIEELSIPMKPMSVNRAWKGRRYKSDEYKAYEVEMLVRLPAGKLPPPPYRFTYEFGFSTRQADYDNPVKPTQDILARKYHFNDNQIYETHIFKRIVKRGKEYIKVRIEHMYDD